MFDETELSPETQWKRAYQNADPSNASGFLDPIEMRRDVARCLLDPGGSQIEVELPINRSTYETYEVCSPQDLTPLLLAVTGDQAGPTSEHHE
jgi:hypothetical protein